ncbi:hypothetical protein V6N13_097805 [Hibiscus sabdariffa]
MNPSYFPPLRLTNLVEPSPETDVDDTTLYSVSMDHGLESKQGYVRKIPQIPALEKPVTFAASKGISSCSLVGEQGDEVVVFVNIELLFFPPRQFDECEYAIIWKHTGF